MARILIVEDYAAQQNIYNSVLTMQGHKVDVAADGEEALEKTAKAEYDLILLDMLLPGLSGIQFLREFDLKGKHPRTKVVAFSNIANPDIVKQATELGVSQYLTKAAHTPKEMSAIIDGLLGKSKKQ